MRLKRDLPAVLQIALEEAEKLMVADSTGNIHSVGWGERITDGLALGLNGVIFTVKRKTTPEVAGRQLIPFVIHKYRTDVVERSPATIELLYLDRGLQATGIQNANQQCHQSPVPGGVQIQPEGKPWVGTLGVKVVYQDEITGALRHGATTNWHVATGDIDRDLHQPNTQKPYVGFVARSPGVSFTETNHVDLAILDIERTDGPYAPLTHCVKPEQLTLGAYQKELSSGGLGTRVARDGRTLGRIDDGEIVQIGATIRVGYGAQGTALFTDQMIVAGGASGDGFSAPGDSGSMVFSYPDMKPSGKLFAGGGGITVVSPAEYMMELGGVHSFQ